MKEKISSGFYIYGDYDNQNIMVCTIELDDDINTAGAIGAILAVFVLFMPFGNNPIHGIQVIINQYIQTIGQYNYMTVNAFNLYGALGKNWVSKHTAPRWE